MELANKKVLVTGGSSGIGRAIAAALIDNGCRVTINGRDEERLAAAAAELGCEAIAGDVGVEADAERIVSTFIEREGGLDVLINNAGFGRFAPLLETRTEDVEEILRTNVVGAFLMGRAAARHMVEPVGAEQRPRSGAIVNIASTAATKGFPGGTAYAASKFALRGMTECWREELRRSDVRVFLVNPSEVITEFAQRAGYDQKASDRKLRPEDIAHAVVGILTMNERGFVPEFSVFATNPF